MDADAYPAADEPRGYAVVDLDGVVADVRHRLGFLDRRPKDWDAFFAAAVGDTVLPQGRAVVERLVAEGLRLVWLTGRPERCRRDTEAWLRRHRLPDAPLYMRRERDRRPARVTKVEVLRALTRDAPVVMTVDDDDQVVRAFRAAGFPVLHADWMSGPDPQPALFDALLDAQESDGRT